MAVATKFFFDMVDSNSTMVMVFGDACSAVSGPIAEISKEWNVWLVCKYIIISIVGPCFIIPPLYEVYRG